MCNQIKIVKINIGWLVLSFQPAFCQATDATPGGMFINNLGPFAENAVSCCNCVSVVSGIQFIKKQKVISNTIKDNLGSIIYNNLSLQKDDYKLIFYL